MKAVYFLFKNIYGSFLFFFILFICFDSIQAQQWDIGSKITQSHRAIDDRFGYSSCISGNTAIVGSYLHDLDSSGLDTLIDAGLVTIFEYSSTNGWVESQRINSSDRESADKFGYAISVSGNRAIISAFEEDHDANGLNFLNRAGSAYIFEKNSQGLWVEHQKIVASDRNSVELFGVSVSIKGDYAIVGAMWESYDTSNTNYISGSGSAYIYKRDPSGVWNEVQKIHAPVRAATDLFGYDVAIDDNWVVVGAYGEDQSVMESDSMPNSGSAYLFKRNTLGKYMLSQKITASIRDSNTFFAKSVNISGNEIIIGAETECYDSIGANEIYSAGAAYIFRKNNADVWVQSQKISASDRSITALFGWDVSITNDYIGVASYRDNYDATHQDFKTYAGSAYIFIRDSSNHWVEQQKVDAFDRQGNDLFGSSINISADRFIIGAQFQDYDVNSQNNLYNAGASYIFDICPIYMESDSIRICAGDSILIFNTYQSERGYYYDTLITSRGCDSIQAFYLDFDTVYNMPPVLIEICDGDSALIFGQNEGISGIFSNVLTSSIGCDSILNVELIVHPNYMIDAGRIDICQGDSAMIFGNYVFSQGTYYDNFTSVKGCDSVLYIDLFVHGPSFGTPSVLNLCQGDSVMIYGNYVNTAGIYRDTISTTVGCDSIIAVTVILRPNNLSSQSTVQICTGKSVRIFGIYRNAAGTYSKTFSTNYGCDSVASVNLTLLPVYSTVSTMELCRGDSVLIGGLFRKSNGTYNEVLTSKNGCDSSVSHTVTFKAINNAVKLEDGVFYAANANANYVWLTCENPGYSVIPGQLDSSFIPTENGSYALALSEGNCRDTSACVEITWVGIESQELDDIRIYPNPVGDMLFLETDIEDYKIELYSTQGQVILYKSLGYDSQIDFSNIQAGCYYMRITKKDKTHILYRLVKK